MNYVQVEYDFSLKNHIQLSFCFNKSINILNISILFIVIAIIKLIMNGSKFI